ncbi:MAG TPA: hypothetical protein VF184_11460 [Phycisphaeraceae bacterium]
MSRLVVAMGLFHQLCRNAGLMIHHIIRPVGGHAQRRQVSRQVEEKKVSDTITLRRTTIEEIEIKNQPLPPEPPEESSAGPPK